MFYLLLGVHIALCVVLIGLVILQQGKGADMGAAFGGGSNTLFGAGGAADFMTRLTTGLAIAFMVSSVLLVKMYQNRGYVAEAGVDGDPLRGSVFQGAPEKVSGEAAPSDSASSVPAPSAPAPVEVQSGDSTTGGSAKAPEVKPETKADTQSDKSDKKVSDKK